MQRIAKFGHVWKHKKTGKIHGASIDVKSIDELREYEQVAKKAEPEAKPNETTEEKQEKSPFFTSKTRGN